MGKKIPDALFLSKTYIKIKCVSVLCLVQSKKIPKYISSIFFRLSTNRFLASINKFTQVIIKIKFNEDRFYYLRRKWLNKCLWLRINLDASDRKVLSKLIIFA